MDADQKKALRIKIAADIEKTASEIVETEKMTEPVKPENSIGRVSRMDAIQNKSVVEAALRTKKEKLTKLKVALSKLDDAHFGICTRCGSEIQSARILYMPESTLCIHCARR